MSYYSEHISVPFLIMLSIIFIYFFTSGYFLRFLRNNFEPVRPSPISSVYSTLTHYTTVTQFFFFLCGTPDGFLQIPDSAHRIFHLP